VIIKFLLIFGLAFAAVIAYRNPTSARSSAIRRLIGAFFLAGGILAVLWPGWVSALARQLGVGRGTDLLLYAFVVASLFIWLGMSRRMYELEQRIVRLTRAVAVDSSASSFDGKITRDV
jgi:small membrane protein